MQILITQVFLHLLAQTRPGEGENMETFFILLWSKSYNSNIEQIWDHT
jgi:hypothetical protein